MSIKLYTEDNKKVIERDVNGDLDYTFLNNSDYNELVNEIKKAHNLKEPVKCPQCHGAGFQTDFILGKMQCDYCKGQKYFLT